MNDESGRGGIGGHGRNEWRTSSGDNSGNERRDWKGSSHGGKDGDRYNGGRGSGQGGRYRGSKYGNASRDGDGGEYGRGRDNDGGQGGRSGGTDRTQRRIESGESVGGENSNGKTSTGNVRRQRRHSGWGNDAEQRHEGGRPQASGQGHQHGGYRTNSRRSKREEDSRWGAKDVQEWPQQQQQQQQQPSQQQVATGAGQRVGHHTRSASMEAGHSSRGHKGHSTQDVSSARAGSYTTPHGGLQSGAYDTGARVTANGGFGNQGGGHDDQDHPGQRFPVLPCGVVPRLCPVSMPQPFPGSTNTSIVTDSVTASGKKFVLEEQVQIPRQFPGFDEALKDVLEHGRQAPTVCKGVTDLYDVVKMVGKGAYGVVQKVRCRRTGELFALKQVVGGDVRCYFEFGRTAVILCMIGRIGVPSEGCSLCG